MSADLEFRSYPAGVAAVRADGGSGMVASGFAIVFNAPSVDLGGFIETIAPGAITDSIAKHEVRALYSHDPAKLLGRTASGTLLLRETPTGLAFSVELPETTLGRDTAVLLARRDLSAMSFGFSVLQDEWAETQAGGLMRLVKELRLYEISIVGNPAYPATSVSL
jgi:uncharacterized protein